MAFDALLEGPARWEQQEREREAVEIRSELDRLLNLADQCISSLRVSSPAELSDPLRVGRHERNLQGHSNQSIGAGQWKPAQVLAADAQDALKALRQLRRRLDLLYAEELNALPSGASSQQKDKLPALLLLNKLDAQYAWLHEELHKAQAAQHPLSRSGREQQLLSQRAQLLGQASQGEGSSLSRRRQLRTEEDRAAVAADITQAMRRTQQVMAQEVQRGLGTLEVLDDSTRTLERSNQQYQSQKGKLSTAQSRLTAMQQMDGVDRLILLAGCLFFCSVCAYILYSRIPFLRSTISFICSLIGFRSSSKVKLAHVSNLGHESGFVLLDSGRTG